MEVAAPPSGHGPLAGVRVIEFGAMGPAPFGCMLLSDLGAKVTRIDRMGADPLAGGGDPRFDFMMRGRERISIDLKSQRGREIALRLAETSDVLVEGFRPGVMEKLGLGPADCRAVNPRLVYGRMTGWGQSGPLADAAGHDINYVALTGALHAIGERNGAPVVPLNLVGDFCGGALYLVTGVIAALFEARSSGEGQVVDAAMIDGVTSLMTPIYAAFSSGFWRDERGSNLLDGGAPFYGVYLTKDARYVAVGAIEPKFFAALLRGLGLGSENLAAQYDRESWPRLRASLAAAFLTRTRSEWVDVFAGTDACVSPVLSLSEGREHPHLKARAVFQVVREIEQSAPAPRFSRTPASIARAAVPPGFDAHSILGRLGFGPGEIDDLERARVIARSS
jgi:alpha-methylacyl-CoA racemase